MHSPIESVSVVVSASKHRESSVKLEQLLVAPAAQATLKDFGFAAPLAPATATAPAK